MQRSLTLLHVSATAAALRKPRSSLACSLCWRRRWTLLWSCLMLSRTTLLSCWPLPAETPCSQASLLRGWVAAFGAGQEQRRTHRRICNPAYINRLWAVLPPASGQPAPACRPAPTCPCCLQSIPQSSPSSAAAPWTCWATTGWRCCWRAALGWCCAAWRSAQSPRWTSWAG